MVVQRPRKNRMPAAIRKIQSKSSSNQGPSFVSNISMMNSKIEKGLKKFGLDPDNTRGLDEACTLVSLFGLVCFIMVTLFFPRPIRSESEALANFIDDGVLPSLKNTKDFYTTRAESLNSNFPNNTKLYLDNTYSALRLANFNTSKNKPEIVFVIDTALDDGVSYSDSARAAIAASAGALYKYTYTNTESTSQIPIAVATMADYPKNLQNITGEDSLIVLIKPTSGMGGLAIRPYTGESKQLGEISQYTESLCKGCYKSMLSEYDNKEECEEILMKKRMVPLLLETMSGNNYDKIFKKNAKQYHNRIVNVLNDVNSSTNTDTEEKNQEKRMQLMDPIEFENVIFNAAATMQKTFYDFIEEYATTKKKVGNYMDYIRALLRAENLDHNEKVAYLRSSRTITILGKNVVFSNINAGLCIVIAFTLLVIDILAFHLDLGVLNKHFLLTSESKAAPKKTEQTTTTDKPSADSAKAAKKSGFITRSFLSLMKIAVKIIIVLALSIGSYIAFSFFIEKANTKIDLNKFVVNLCNGNEKILIYLVAVTIFAIMMTVFGLFDLCFKRVIEKCKYRAEYYTYFHASGIATAIVASYCAAFGMWDSALSFGHVALFVSFLTIGLDIMHYAGVFKSGGKKGVISALMDVQNTLWWKDAMLSACCLLSVIIVAVVPVQIVNEAFNSQEKQYFDRITAKIVFSLALVYIIPISSYTTSIKSKWIFSPLLLIGVTAVYFMFMNSNYKMSKYVYEMGQVEDNAMEAPIISGFGARMQTNIYIKCNEGANEGLFDCSVVEDDLLNSKDYLLNDTIRNIHSIYKEDTQTKVLKFNVLGRVIEAEIEKPIFPKKGSCQNLKTTTTEITRAWRGNVIVSYCF